MLLGGGKIEVGGWGWACYVYNLAGGDINWLPEASIRNMPSMHNDAYKMVGGRAN